MRSFYLVSANARGMGRQWGKSLSLLMHQFGRVREMRLTSRLGSLVFCHVQQCHHHDLPPYKTSLQPNDFLVFFLGSGRRKKVFRHVFRYRSGILKSVMDISASFQAHSVHHQSTASLCTNAPAAAAASAPAAGDAASGASPKRKVQK